MAKGITIRQRRVAKNLIDNIQTHRFKLLQDLLMDAGYSELTSKQVGKTIIQSKGVQKCLEKLGFNEQAAKAAVAEILLLGKEENRLRASDMIFKVKGTYAPEKSIQLKGDIVKLVEQLDDERRSTKKTGKSELEIKSSLQDNNEG